MALAADNAGPGTFERFGRRHRDGLNPNVCFNPVEQGAAKAVGRETVQYVSNIYKYYVAYAMLWMPCRRTRKAVSGKAD